MPTFAVIYYVLHDVFAMMSKYKQNISKQSFIVKTIIQNID